MASKIIVDQIEKTGGSLTALTLPTGNASAGQVLQNDGSGNLSWAADAGGKILQVVYFPYSTAETSTSATLSDTSLTVDITPVSTSNKVLILLSVPVRSDRNSTYTGTVLAAAKFAITRGGSEIYVNQLHSSGANFTSGTSYIETNLSIAYLDSPSADAATTYTFQISSTQTNMTTTAFIGGLVGNIIAMEIAA